MIEPRPAPPRPAAVVDLSPLLRERAQRDYAQAYQASRERPSPEADRARIAALGRLLRHNPFLRLVE